MLILFDKDMADIRSLKSVWDAKISICWWHLWWAVQAWLAKRKLATTLYNPKHTHAGFVFIDVWFAPQGKSDQKDYESGMPNIGPSVIKEMTRVTLPTGLCIRVQAWPLLSITQDANIK
jgi:hypothetical protein